MKARASATAPRKTRKTEAAVSLLVALEEAAEVELRAAVLGDAAELPGSGLADVRDAMPQQLPRD
jgi:hypothetical protein